MVNTGKKLTPSQKLWAEVFRCSYAKVPPLDEQKVRSIIDTLFDVRERTVIYLRFGFDGPPLTMEEVASKLPRADGGMGISRQNATYYLDKALGHLRHPARRKALEEAKVV